MPALPNNAAFLAAIQAMTVTGVARHYDEPPASIDISAGYCAFPTMPDGARGEQVSTCITQSKTRSIGYVVIIEATGQDTTPKNYDKLATVMDNLETAIDGLAPATVNFVEYEISTTGNYPVGGSEYWAVVATITARDQ